MTSQNSVLIGEDEVTKSLVDIAVEAWRFSKSVDRIIRKLDAGEQNRHWGQLRWFTKKIEESLEVAGIRLVDVEGQRFDPGVAATPINIGEFHSDDELFVEQMLEPIIMRSGVLLRSGTVTLRKTAT